MSWARALLAPLVLANIATPEPAHFLKETLHHSSNGLLYNAPSDDLINLAWPQEQRSVQFHLSAIC